MSAISGPSLLGLDEPNPARSIDDDVYDPFRSSRAVLEPDDHVTRRRRILALVALLLALGAAARWSYYSYIRATGSSTGATASNQPSPASSPATTSPQAPTAAAPANPEPQSATEASQPAPAAPEETHAEPPKSATAPAKSSETVAKAEAPSSPAMRVTAKRSKTTPAERSSAADSVVAAKMPASEGNGDADYRKGEAYLYGHGVSANCEQAMKFLKSASAKQSAKARSTFGTMYATGHCVPRDLPTSYEWFALALQADPNNQILEKDLNAIWNQMTPPERELATKSRQ